MRSVSRHRIVAKLLADADVDSIDAPVENRHGERPASGEILSAEEIVEREITGQAFVELLAVTVRNSTAEGTSSPSAVTELIATSELSDAPRFNIVISPAVIGRFVQLGIENPARHLRGQRLQVWGTIEKIEQPPPGSGDTYELVVESLDQIVSLLNP